MWGFAILSRSLRRLSGSIGLTPRYMETSDSLEDQTSEQLIFLPEAFRANRFLKPGSAEAQKMTVTSGRRCYELFKRQSPLGSLERTLLASSAWHSTTCFLTWKPKGTKRGRLYYQLAPSMPRIEEIGCGLLHTPTTGESTEKYEKRYPGGKERKVPVPNLAAEIRDTGDAGEEGVRPDSDPGGVAIRGIRRGPLNPRLLSATPSGSVVFSTLEGSRPLAGG